MNKRIVNFFVGLVFIGSCIIGVLVFFAFIFSLEQPSVPVENVRQATSETSPTLVLSKTSAPTRTPRPTSTISFTDTPISYIEVDWKDFVTYPDKYYDQYIKITGEILWIDDRKNFTMSVGDYTVFNDSVAVTTTDSFDSLYENDRVVVLGIVKDECSTDFSIADAFICDAIVEKP